MQALWTVALPEDSAPWFVVHGRHVIVEAGRKRFGIDLETGTTRSRHAPRREKPRPSREATGDDNGDWVASDERGRAVCDGEKLRVLDAKGRELWKQAGVSSIYGVTKVSVACEEKARLVLRDRKTGEKIATLGPRPKRLHAVTLDALFMDDDGEVVAWSPRGEERWRCSTPGYDASCVDAVAKGFVLLLRGLEWRAPLLVRLGARPGSGVLELPGPHFQGPAWPGEKAALRRRNRKPTTHYFAEDEWTLLEPHLAGIPFELGRSRTWDGRPSFAVTVPGSAVEAFQALVKKLAPVVRARRLAARPKTPVFVVVFDVLEPGSREPVADGSCVVGAPSRAAAKKTALAWLNRDTLQRVGYDAVRCRWSATVTLADFESERGDTLEPHRVPRLGRVVLLDVGS